jgi:hypothetical protein
VSSLIYVIVLPYTALATTYLYFDLRVAERREPSVEEVDGVLPEEAAVLAPS